MAVPNKEEIVVQYRFTYNTPQGTFVDAINYTQTEFAASTQTSRRAAATVRVQAWLATTHKEAPRPTKRSLRQAYLATVEDMQNQMTTLATALTDPTLAEE